MKRKSNKPTIRLPIVDLGAMQRSVADSLKALKTAEKAEQRASSTLMDARVNHSRALVGFRNAFASVEGENK